MLLVPVLLDPVLATVETLGDDTRPNYCIHNITHLSLNLKSIYVTKLDYSKLALFHIDYQ
jgi:hypothetical protein